MGDNALTSVRSLELSGGQRLLLERSPCEDVVSFVGRDGRVSVVIHVTEQGPVLRFEGARLAIQAAGELSLEADHLSLHARKGLRVSSGGNLALHASGDLESTARIQTITADLGNVSLKANDDVKLNGERVLVNC